MIAFEESATGSRLLGGWASGDAGAGTWPGTGTSYPAVTGWSNISAGSGVNCS